jgi:lantibiotic leader peptide-processing serine protease
MRKNLRLRVVLGLLVTMVCAVFGSASAGAVGGTAEAKTYIVLYKNDRSPAGAAATMAAAGGELVYNYDKIGVVIARSASPNFAATLKQDSRVEGATATEAYGSQLNVGDVEVVDGVEAPAETTAWGDPGTGINQWDMYQIHVPEAHEVTTGSRSVVVGILDTGVDYNHQDLKANVNLTKSASCESGAPVQDPAAFMDRHGHGTHTAGTIAAAQNGVGIVGIAPNVQLAAVKSANDSGFFYPEMVVCAYVWAAEQKLDITNNSYFVDPWWMNCRNDADQRTAWKAIQRAIRYAMNQGVTVVAAAGNDYYDLTHPTTDTQSPDDSTPVTRDVTNACVVIPAEISGVVTVSSVGYFNRKASYSNFGMGAIQVAAPGGDGSQRPPGLSSGSIYSTYPGNRYARMSGTSMASPHAAGVAALIVSKYGKMAPGRLQAILTSTADPLNCPAAPTTCVGDDGGYTSYFGHGLINALQAVTHTTN